MPAPPRRRALLALALAAVVGISTLGIRETLDHRADLVSHKRGIEHLTARAESAERELEGLRRAAGKIAEEGSLLGSELNALKQVAPLDAARLAKELGPSVVTIITPRALGSGFVVLSRDGTSSLITNYHVVADVWRTGGRTVSVDTRSESLVGTILRVNESDDVALVVVPAPSSLSRSRRGSRSSVTPSWSPGLRGDSRGA